jgi:DNA (cytosine-5)-methyltransferase 1
MTLGSLFDGISGFPLAASWVGIETKWISEIDPYCQKVSKKNFPNAKQYGDITELFKPESVDIISGGFPCQSFSLAGKGEMDLSLWKEMLRIIQDVSPRWVIAENVYGLVSRKQGMALETVCTDLENEGFAVFPPLVLPACSVGAPHKRERVWIVANRDNRFSQSEKQKIQAGRDASISICEALSNASSFGLERSIQDRNCSKENGGKHEGRETTGRDSQAYRRMWATEPAIRRVDDGIPDWMEQIKSYGNAIVPQVAFEIFKAIVEIEDHHD